MGPERYPNSCRSPVRTVDTVPTRAPAVGSQLDFQNSKSVTVLYWRRQNDTSRVVCTVGDTVFPATISNSQLATAFADLLSSPVANSAINARLIAAWRVGAVVCGLIRSVTEETF